MDRCNGGVRNGHELAVIDQWQVRRGADPQRRLFGVVRLENQSIDPRPGAMVPSFSHVPYMSPMSLLR